MFVLLFLNDNSKALLRINHTEPSIKNEKKNSIFDLI
jgi:hypothetical protein